MKAIAGARIKSGKLTFKQRSVFLDDISKLKDGDYIVTVERQKKTRSIQQSRYYWGVVVPLVKDGLNDIGYKLTTESVHEFLKGQFNVKEIINENSGEILKAVGSTTELTTSGMMEYFAQIQQWATEYLNIYIPDPNQQTTLNL